MPEWLVTLVRGPLGPRPKVGPVAVRLTADAHGNLFAGGMAIAGPAATGFPTPGQGVTGGHPGLSTMPSGTFQHLPRGSLGP